MDAGTNRLVFGITFIITFACCVTTVSASAGEISGLLVPCTNEGEVIPIERSMNCFRCICQFGFVVCEKEITCPPVEDCYMLENKKGCCEQCKGCTYEGKNYPSGAEWTAKDDPCSNLKCVAGVVTASNLQCYTPCENPIPARKGQCCPTCLGCNLGGQYVHEGDDVSLSVDPCLKCSCSNKRLTCVKKACPILQCPAGKQIWPEGECCPRCSEKRQITQVPGKCILGKGLHSDGKTFFIDSVSMGQCKTTSSCSCVNGTSICRRNTCPVLECATELQEINKSTCCMTCAPIAQARSTCTFEGKTYMNNETWKLDRKLDICASCICQSGTINCVRSNCPAVKCKPGEEKVTPPGQCCARCVETPGICTVWGDPHYKTFDGQYYSFKGSCKYQLTADCVDHTFSIRVTNDGRNTKSSSWTKTVTLKLGTVKVNLGQKRRVKVNGTRVLLPYNLGTQLTIEDADDVVSVKTEIGINLLWDGNNFLQVEAAPKYKNKLCGLCGNYNKIYKDDLIGRFGVNYTTEIWRFANSWKVGGPKACSRKHENLAKITNCRRSRGERHCRLISDFDAFGDCGSKLNSVKFYESCKMDMCDCPSGKCYCDSFLAYARECTRLGVNMSNWRSKTNCDVKTLAAVAADMAAVAATSSSSSSLLSSSSLSSSSLSSSSSLTSLSSSSSFMPSIYSPSLSTLSVVATKPHPTQLKRHRKRTKPKRPDFLNKHIPKTFLVHKHNGRTPPPIH